MIFSGQIKLPVEELSQGHGVGWPSWPVSGRVNLLDGAGMAVSENAALTYRRMRCPTAHLPFPVFFLKCALIRKRSILNAAVTPAHSSPFAWLNPYARQMSRIVQIIYFIFI